jgi:thiol-disulfide isomerase/thioredoxin
LPVLFIGDQVLSGEKEIMERLDPLILDYQIKGAPALPPLQTLVVAKPSEKGFSVELAYFYQKGCPKCDRANLLLKYIAQKYPRLDVKQIDLNTPDGKRFNETLSNRLNLPAKKRLIAPSIFVETIFFHPRKSLKQTSRH